MPDILTLLGTGGGVQHPPYRKSALRPSNDPKFCDFSYFYMTYLKSKKKLVFHSDFGCLEEGGGKHPPPLDLHFQSHHK